MNRYIIGFGDGPFASMRTIEARTLSEAEGESARRSMAQGLLDDDLADTTWAELFTPERAYDLGLEEYED